MARRRAAAVAGEQLQPFRETLREPAQAEEGDPARGQLDRQRQSVQLAAQVDHRGDVVVSQLEASIARLRLTDEQRDRAEADCLGRSGADFGHRERPEPEYALAVGLQRDLAGDEQAHARRAGGDRVGQPRDLIDEVLGVVEQQQDVERLHPRDQRRDRLLAAADGQAQRLRDGHRHQRRARQRRQIDPGGAVAVRTAPRLRRRQRQHRLADATGTEHADMAVLREQVLQRREFVVAAEQRRRGRQRERLRHGVGG